MNQKLPNILHGSLFVIEEYRAICLRLKVEQMFIIQCEDIKFVISPLVFEPVQGFLLHLSSGMKTS